MGRSEERKDRKRQRSRSVDSRDRNKDKYRDRKERRKRRSRSPDSRSPSRDRKSSRKDDKRTSSKRENEKSDSRKQSERESPKKDEKRRKDPVLKKKTTEELEKEKEMQKEAEQAALDEEMRKRRERVKAWQEAKAKRLAEENGLKGQNDPNSNQKDSIDGETNEMTNGENDDKDGKHKWSLEDDGDDDSDENTEFQNSEIPEPVADLNPMIPALKKEEISNEDSSVFSKRKNKKIKNNKWENEKPVENSTTINEKEVKKEENDDDDDPLDAFMSSLYGTGDVEKQLELPAIKQKSQGHQIEENEKPKNLVITMDEILENMKNKGSKKIDKTIDKSIDKSNEMDIKTEKRGWESDVPESGSNSPDHMGFIKIKGFPISAEKNNDFLSSNEELTQDNENNDDDDDFLHKNETEEEREARELREKQEFLEALRKSREEEDLMREKLLKADEEEAMKKNKKETELGRVFAGDGDMVEETEIETKKKSALEIIEEARKGKMLKEVDHSKIEYIPFRKNLYIVPRALSRLSEVEVIEKREDLQIKVRGRGCPVPVDNWEQCGLSDRILETIHNLELKPPFPIQQQAIPAIMCGRDVIGVAKTGSGKTLAFLLPMLRHILDQPPLKDGEGPIGLIMAPARELALQIYHQAKKFTKALGLRAACIYGGAGVAEQIADLKRGSEIVVCTPGRMIDILTMQAGKLVSLKRVTMVVMDEADRMFDMGFEPQIRMIIQNIRPDRQTVLFSATFPKQIEKLAKTVLKLPLEIVVGERSTVNKDITQYVEVHEEDDKFLRLLQLLGVWYERGHVLIFVEKQEKCDQLFQELLKLGYPCLSLHGGKDQVDRDHTLHEFKTGIKTVMIATSVAGRGLDVPEIVCVINYHCPNHPEDYVHRVGRTGRAGRKGTAYTFISQREEQYSPSMVKTLEKAGQPVPQELQEMYKNFKEKVSRGEAQWSGGGVRVGKGYTFDASEMNETQKIASMQRKQYEVEQGLAVPEADDADDEADDDDEKPLTSVPSTLPGTSTSATSTSSSIDAAAAFARARLVALEMASRGANGLNALSAADGRDYYAEELEINDYPHQARKKVTNRTAIEEITERTGVAIISRGSYIPPGKTAQFGERRLHLLIEGDDEMSVKQAKLEIEKELEEETMRLGASGSLAASTSASGRYSVL